MSKALKMFDGVTRSPILNTFALDGLNENMSIMAIDDKTDQLLGVSINQIAKPSHLDPDTELEEYLRTYNDARFHHILKVLSLVNQNAGDLFKNMNTNKFFDIKMVTTDKRNRKGGLAKDLLQRSVELARVLGFSTIKTEATGNYIAACFT